MKYILDARQMKAIDTFSIEECGIPSLVLMERASLNVTRTIEGLEGNNGKYSKVKVLCVCGSGNNGADGLCVARQLFQLGFDVDVLYTSKSNGTEEYQIQKKIVDNLGIKIVSNWESNAYKYIVEGIFGIGLSRVIEGETALLIDKINTYRINYKDEYNTKLVAIDIPSGVDATTGQIMGIGIKADYTVTFGYKKLGQVLYPGANYCGEVSVADAGFCEPKNVSEYVFCYDDKDIQGIPKRQTDGNKGTFGKALIIAGSKEIGGAALLSAKACARMGAGLVKTLTHKNNRNPLMTFFPEGLIATYGEGDTFDLVKKKVNEGLAWSRVCVCGPGLGKDEYSECILGEVLNDCSNIKIFDADALNLIAMNSDKYAFSKWTGNKSNEMNSLGNIRIITPHIVEMARLTGFSIKEIKDKPIDIAKEYAKNQGVICVLKDARTVVTDGERVYINTSGNSGMATGGSGDVLTGIIAGNFLNMLAADLDTSLIYDAVCMGVYLHGRAGDFARDTKGEHGLLASDIIDYIPIDNGDYYE